MKLLQAFSGACFTILSSWGTFAAVNDVLPADYFPLAAGTSTVAVYGYERKASGYYDQNRKQAEGELNTEILALRVGHFLELAGRPVSVIAVLPWANAGVEPAGLASVFGKDARGMGDLRFGATGWLLSDRNSGQYLGITAMVSLPTGDYERTQALSIGENRYKATLSLGWIQPLANSLNLEITPELAWFGDNPDYIHGNKLEQKISYALTGYLRYRLTPNWQLHAGGQLNYGGETKINGTDRNDAPDNSRIMLGTTYNSDSRQHQWIVRLAKDMEIKNGFKTDAELLVRYLWMF
jgi:hypothetical protein